MIRTLIRAMTWFFLARAILRRMAGHKPPQRVTEPLEAQTDNGSR
jgi:hypothetical protein